MARGDRPAERVARNIFQRLGRRRQQESEPEAEPEVDAGRVQSVAKTVGDVGIQAANQEELMEKIAASGRAPESFDIFTARSGASFAVPSEQFSADMQAGLKDMGFFQTQVASAGSPGAEAVAPAGAEASDSFQGAGGFSYTFEPETGNYVITAAPEEYAHLTGVTVPPGSHAYASIQAEHQTGKSLWRAKADEPRRTVDVEGEETVITADPLEEYDVFNPPGAEGDVEEPVEEFDVEKLGDVSRIGPGAQDPAPLTDAEWVAQDPARRIDRQTGERVTDYSVPSGPYKGRMFDPRSRAQILREEAVAKAMENQRMLEEARRSATMFGGGKAAPTGTMRVLDEDSGLPGDTGG